MKKICLTIALLSVSLMAVEDLGVYGTLYPILEESYMVEIEEKSKSVDWSKQIKSFKKSFKDSFVAKGNLPKCVQTTERAYVKMNTLKYPITGPSGEVVLPAGYTYNVLELMYKNGLVATKAMLFVDIDDGLHFEYSELMKKTSDIYAIDGNIEKAAAKGLEVERGDWLIKDLDIKCVPSLYIQEKSQFRILEIDNNELKAIIKAIKVKGD